MRGLETDSPPGRPILPNNMVATLNKAVLANNFIALLCNIFKKAFTLYSNYFYMYKYTQFLFIICIATACKTKNPSEITPPSNLLKPAMSSSAIYNFDSVAVYLQNISSLQADSAKKFFLKAIDTYKNAKKPMESIADFTSSITLYPDKKAYYELGNAMLDANKPDLALTAFNMAEKLNYDPLGYVLFKKACCYATLKKEDNYENVETAREYIQFAVENGFTDREKLMNEPKLKSINEYGGLASIYNEAMAGYGGIGNVLWNDFSSNFTQISFPLTINMETIKKLGETKAIGYDYEKFVTEMRDYKFSRDVGNEFFYYTKVAATPTYQTVVYGSRSYDYGDGEKVAYIPCEFYMASFNKDGKLLDKVILAGNLVYDKPFLVATLQQNGSFEIKEFTNQFEKDVSKEGYENNKIVKSNLLNTTKYQINDKGMFIADKKLLAMN